MGAAALRITTLDAHTAGEPLRIITSGFPEPPGDTILAKRAWVREHAEPLRRALMWEPRGHADMYGALPVPPVTDDGDLGVLFLHNEGWSTMCGHGVIGLVTVALDEGLLERPGDAPVVRLDTPAGRVTATAHREHGRVARVSFENVPSFLVAADLSVEVDGLGAVDCDLGYGGAFYAYVDADAVGLELRRRAFPEIVALGKRIKQAVVARHPVRHPDGDPDLGFLYGVIFHGHAAPDEVLERNVCVFADGEVDRSPTGTGVSGRVACLVARGALGFGETVEIESLLGTRFTVCAERATTVGGVDAVVPRVTGSAHLTGRHEFVIDPADPLREGFLLR